MSITHFGNMLADFEIRLYNLEAGLKASIEAVQLERNAMMNSIDEAANKQLDDLHKYVELVQALRGIAPDNVTELRVNDK